MTQSFERKGPYAACENTACHPLMDETSILPDESAKTSAATAQPRKKSGLTALIIALPGLVMVRL